MYESVRTVFVCLVDGDFSPGLRRDCLHQPRAPTKANRNALHLVHSLNYPYVNQPSRARCRRCARGPEFSGRSPRQSPCGLARFEPLLRVDVLATLSRWEARWMDASVLESAAMAQGVPVDDITQSEVLGLWNKHRERVGKSYTRVEVYQEIAIRTHLSMDTVANIIRKHTPTIHLARAKMQAAASDLVDRVILKAGVQEAIDILSRPNMGVLAPHKQAAGAGGGFFLSVSADSLSSVKVGIATVGERPALEAGDAVDAGEVEEGDFSEYRGDGGEWAPAESSGGGESAQRGPDGGDETGGAADHWPQSGEGGARQARLRDVIEAARAKLRRHSGQQGVQGADGGSEAAGLE